MGLPAKLFTPPQRPRNPAAVISETHMRINQAIEHLTIHPRLCAWVFRRCLRHLWYLALGTGFSLIDRILSDSSWLGQTNLNIWGWHTASGTTCEWSVRVLGKALADGWILKHRRRQNPNADWILIHESIFPEHQWSNLIFTHYCYLLMSNGVGESELSIISFYMELLSEGMRGCFASIIQTSTQSCGFVFQLADIPADIHKATSQLPRKVRLVVTEEQPTGYVLGLQFFQERSMLMGLKPRSGHCEFSSLQIPKVVFVLNQ